MRAFSSAILLLFVFAAMMTQTVRGGIQGTVTDSSGAAVAAADVSVHSAETGLVRTTKTNYEVDCLVSELPLGTYSVSASKQGFGTKVMNGVAVAVSTST